MRTIRHVQRKPARPQTVRDRPKLFTELVCAGGGGDSSDASLPHLCRELCGDEGVRVRRAF